uniref:Protein kinase domain-containing protein n=1 Tax=Macrostomum lignano TaxID=282301 RepID=A0A1I8J759_9PLAT
DEELQLQLPPPSPTMGAPRQQQQQQQQHGEFQQSADSFVVQHRENPHGIEANSTPTATDMETENQLRISWRMGSFNRQPVRQLQLVTNTDEAWAAANRLLSFHRQLAHPHLAPLLGSQKFSGSVDLYFPVYQCTLEDAYCCRIMTKFRCPLDFESRLRLLFGIAKALLYLHGGQQAGQSFVLGNLAANSVMLDSFWCPAICDLTELREADANENFSADVSAFKTVAMETLTGWSSRQDRRKFNEAVNKVDELLTLQPDTRDQLVLDSECLMPDEMRPDETQVDEDDISLMCRLYQNFLILMHKTAGI